MANELTGSFSLSFYKPAIMTGAEAISIANYIGSVSGNAFSRGTLLVGVTATAFPLGQVTQPGFCVFNNLDPNNYVSLQNGSGGSEFSRLLQSGLFFGPLGPSVVPYATANTEPCFVQFLIIAM
jgi:hypothetical protein